MRSASLRGGEVTSLELERSVLKSSMLMEFMRRKEWSTGGFGGGFVVVRREMRGKWSDGDVGRAVTVGERGESTAVMSRSRVLPLV